jgi:hypothetical protein
VDGVLYGTILRWPAGTPRKDAGWPGAACPQALRAWRPLHSVKSPAGGRPAAQSSAGGGGRPLVGAVSRQRGRLRLSSTSLIRGDSPAKRRDDAGEARRARNCGPRRRRARVLNGVACGRHELTLELVVGERSGRRIVGCWAVPVLLPLEGHVRFLQVVAVVKPNCSRRTETASFFSLRQRWEREVTPTILRHMMTLATELMAALETSSIMSASEARGAGAGAPVSADSTLLATALPISSRSYRRARHRRRRLQETR